MKKSASLSSESNALSLTAQQLSSAESPQWSLNASIVQSEGRRQCDREHINNPHPPSQSMIRADDVETLPLEPESSESPLQSLLAFTVKIAAKEESELSSQKSLAPSFPPENHLLAAVVLTESPSLELLSNLVPYTWLEPPMPVVSHRKGAGVWLSPSLAEEWTTQVRKQKKANDLCS
eukprot:GILI01004860.1.p1 GENE.GILI01004860.1~~GILI01004860.1.p1  ORF type:complete len:178 (+),score=12.77 GILI01004860.1:61-594(+)